jgi:hypothetical protein
MASPVESNEFRRLLSEGLKKVWTDGKYADLKSPIDRIMNTMSSTRWAEEFFSVSGVGDILPFGGKITYLPMFPGFYTRIEPAEYAAGIQFERKLLDDEKYSVIDKKATRLFRSANRTIEKMKVGALPSGFSTAFDFGISEEGVALFSNSHLTKSGTSTSSGFDNLGVSAMSKTSVAATRLAMRQFRDDGSERIEMSDRFTLVFPDELEEQVYEIVKTKSGLDSAEGNENYQFGRYDTICIPRLSDYDANDWYMVDAPMAKEDFHFVERIKPEPKDTWDFETYILKLALYMRNGVGFTGWRWGFGNKVS